ncbi:MAG: hypothetical protein JSV95_13080 [Gemmatimonadota bacterium]|nr:MAG: hypothetical protein JSV95_13080 [Gemmatimonadota bacterium]
MSKKKAQPESFIDRRSPDRTASRVEEKEVRYQPRTGGVLLRSGRRSRAFGWRGPSPAGVSPFFR